MTDTGRFMYENTGPRAHLMAAELIEAGVDVQAIYRRLYEEMPYAEAGAARAGLGQRQRFDAGELTIAVLSAEDFRRVPRPRRATPRGSSTICARCGARRWQRSCAS